MHKNLVKIARVVPGISSQTDRHTDTDTNTQKQTYSSQYFTILINRCARHCYVGFITARFKKLSRLKETTESV